MARPTIGVMSGLEHPSDRQRAEAIQAAVSAARDSRRGRSHIGFYEVIAEHWLALETAVALNAAVSALEAAGFCVKRPDHLRAAALDAARAHFWPHHIIIDSLDMDVHAAAIVGIEAALKDYRPITAAEYEAAVAAARAQPRPDAAC